MDIEERNKDIDRLIKIHEEIYPIEELIKKNEMVRAWYKRNRKKYMREYYNKNFKAINIGKRRYAKSTKGKDEFLKLVAGNKENEKD